jgi:HTH-type transcriptional regulator / antitoxin MqsA
MSRNLACPQCAKSSITVHREERICRSLEGDGIPYPAEYSRCESCGEEFYTRQQSRANTRALVGIERQRAGRLTPQEILAIRQGYGVTQEQMEAIVGVGKKSWGRWENGLVCQSRSADQLLREIRFSPALFARLADKAGVKIPSTAKRREWLFHSTVYGVSDEVVVMSATTSVPARLRPGPAGPAETEDSAIDWSAILETSGLTDKTGGARVNQTTGSTGPALTSVVQ